MDVKQTTAGPFSWHTVKNTDVVGWVSTEGEGSQVLGK